jgi:uncharacterized protein
MIVSASLTERCNLRCDYCYAPVGHGPDMTEETLVRIVDWAVEATPSGDTLELGFFGGEPFLRKDLMRTGAMRAKRAAARTSTPLRLRVTTNGTLLTDAALDVIDEHGIDLCVSIDGPPAEHDKHRRFANGRGSSAVVAANLQRAIARLGRAQVNVVYGPDTVRSLPDTVRYLMELGVRLIHLNPNICTTWPAATHAWLREAYGEIGQIVVTSFERGDPVAVNLIDNKIILFLKDGYGPEDRCGMGETKVGFAPNGDMYPCERLIGAKADARLCIGNARSGPDRARVASVRTRAGNRNPDCGTCPVRRFCMNWCGCTNYHLTGETDVAAPVLCASEQAAIATAHTAMVKLVQNDHFIEHLEAYVLEAQHPPRGGRS